LEVDGVGCVTVEDPAEPPVPGWRLTPENMDPDGFAVAVTVGVFCDGREAKMLF
jgi:hypothetical protein